MSSMEKPRRRYLAVDLGAESGRGMLATLEDGRVALEEVHRFPNEPVQLLETLFWDAPRLFHEIKVAIRCGAERARAGGDTLDGIGIDAWGVDCALLDARGGLLANPVHYRDSRTDGIMERVFERVPRRRIFEETGLLFMQFNTLYQLAAELERDPARLEAVSKVVWMPDLFHYLLTGRVVTERTVASTSQMYHAGRDAWCTELMAELGIPSRILPELAPSGTVIGPLRDAIALELGLDYHPPVIASACHDTGAAVAAVPAVEPLAGADETWGFLSSGTWSLMGVELPDVLAGDAVLESRFTNEAAAGGGIRFLRIIMGLWLVQESRRIWEHAGIRRGYDELTRLAESAPELVSLVDPDDPVFFRSGDMPERIRELCRRSGEPVPESDGAVLRCALESLALAYADCARRIHELTGRRIARLHVVGGGSKNHLLDQLTANALGVPVVAGPAEATALGNALLQAVATGALASIDDVRRVVADSTDTKTFRPDRASADAWRRAEERFRALRRESSGFTKRETPMSEERLRRAFERFDAANAEDPNVETWEGVERPKELLYAERMTRWLEELEPNASEALRLAARSQHIRRWELPRSEFPNDRIGYLKWRTTLYGFHAETAARILGEVGYDEPTIARVRSLLKKEKLASDAEAQTLEDVACLVFLEAYFTDFARKHDEAKLRGIIQKTWKKMSERARERALALPLDSDDRALIESALG